VAREVDTFEVDVEGWRACRQFCECVNESCYCADSVDEA